MSATALPPRNPPSGRWTRFILPVYTALMILYLASPVLVMILYGFNDIPGERNTPKFWGFTLDWWRDPFGVAGLTKALRTSLLVAPASAIVATAIGTLLGLALGRYRFRGKAPANFIIFLAIQFVVREIEFVRLADTLANRVAVLILEVVDQHAVELLTLFRVLHARFDRIDHFTEQVAT